MPISAFRYVNGHFGSNFVFLKVEILTTINCLTDEKGREILRMRYIELVPWNEIRMRFGYSDSWIFKKQNKAMDELDELLKR